MPFDKDYRFLVSKNIIINTNARPGRLIDMCMDAQYIIVQGRPFILNSHVYDWHLKTGFFQGPIGQPQFSQRFGPGCLKVVEVMRMIYNAHGVAFSVTHTMGINVGITQNVWMALGSV